MTHCRVIHCFPGRIPVRLPLMRRVWPLLIVLLSASVPAFAQVTVDLHALDALPGSGTSTQTPAKHPTAPRRPARQLSTAKPSTPPSEQVTIVPPIPSAPSPSAPAPGAPVTGQVPPPSPPPATLPSTTPPTVALVPIPLPTAPEAPPPPPPISDTSASAATPSTAGLQVTFGSGQADL